MVQMVQARLLVGQVLVKVPVFGQVPVFSCLFISCLSSAGSYGLAQSINRLLVPVSVR